MKDRDIEALVKALAPVVRDFVGKQVAAITERQDALEKRLSELPHYATAKELAALASAHNEVREMVASIPPVPTAEEVAALIPAPDLGKELGPFSTRLADLEEAGKASRESIETIRTEALEAVDRAVPEAVSAAVAALSIPNAEEVAAIVKTPTAEEIAALVAAPEIDAETLKAAVNEEVGRQVSALPVAPTAAEVAALMPDPPQGEKGDPGKDGISLAGVLKDHEGCLVFTLSDGSITKVAHVDGVDGKDGAPGRDADPAVIHAAVQEEVQKQVMAPLATAYKGVWKPDAYKSGDVVTWGGSLWLAKAETSAKPESTDDWTLIVKRGRDGKDGEAPKPPKQVKL